MAAPPSAPSRTGVDGPAIREIARYSPSAADAEGLDGSLQMALASVRSRPTISSHYGAALEYQRLGILDKAFAHLQLGAALDEHHPGINDGLARIWRDWGLPGMGLASAHHAVYAAPRSPVPRHTLGTLLFALGQRAESEKAFRQVVDLDPSAWYGWQNLCHLAMTDGRTREAIAFCQRATTLRREALKAANHERH